VPYKRERKASANGKMPLTEKKRKSLEKKKRNGTKPEINGVTIKSPKFHPSQGAFGYIKM